VSYEKIHKGSGIPEGQGGPVSWWKNFQASFKGTLVSVIGLWACGNQGFGESAEECMV